MAVFATCLTKSYIFVFWLFINFTLSYVCANVCLFSKGVANSLKKKKRDVIIWCSVCVCLRVCVCSGERT